MARPLRMHVTGMIYHVISRGNAGQTIFADEQDCERYLELIARTTRRFDVRCLGYSLMGNHVHLLLQPASHPISRMMQQLNSIYCQGFNRRHGRSGHVLQGRYKALLVETPDYFLDVLRYVVLNPVKAKFVAHPADWKWSSYRATAGLETCPEFLRIEEVWGSLNASDERSAHELFIEYVNVPRPTSLPTRALILGCEAFVKRFRPMLHRYQEVRDFVQAERFAARPTLSELMCSVTDRTAAALAARQAFHDYAYTLADIGAHVQRAPATIWVWVHRVARTA